MSLLTVARKDFIAAREPLARLLGAIHAVVYLSNAFNEESDVAQLQVGEYVNTWLPFVVSYASRFVFKSVLMAPRAHPETGADSASADTPTASTTTSTSTSDSSSATTDTAGAAPAVTGEQNDGNGDGDRDGDGEWESKRRVVESTLAAANVHLDLPNVAMADWSGLVTALAVIVARVLSTPLFRRCVVPPGDVAKLTESRKFLHEAPPGEPADAASTALEKFYRYVLYLC